MKKLKLMIALLFIGMIGLFAQDDNPSYYEQTSIQRIMVQSAENVVLAENDLSMEIVRLEIDLILGTDWKYTFRTLSSTWEYTIYTEGESGQVSDMDLRVMTRSSVTGEWEEVTSDTDADFSALVTVKPLETRQYAIGVKAAEYYDGYSGSHYFVIIAHDKPE